MNGIFIFLNYSLNIEFFLNLHQKLDQESHILVFTQRFSFYNEFCYKVSDDRNLTNFKMIYD